MAYIYFTTSQFLGGENHIALGSAWNEMVGFLSFSSAVTKNQSAAIPHLLTAFPHRDTEVSIHTTPLHITHTPGSQTEPFRDVSGKILLNSRAVKFHDRDGKRF